MQKAFFNDRYQQTDAVIEGRKTRATQIMTGIDFPVNMVMGRALPDKDGKIYAVANGENIIVKLRYKVGEVVAVAQSYEAAGFDPGYCIEGGLFAQKHAGWHNKMFVKPALMSHRIRITGIKCERLQDISDEDCFREGISESWYESTDTTTYGFADEKKGTAVEFDTPRQAFAALIDKVSGRGTWKSNPWVVVYEFELVK